MKYSVDEYSKASLSGQQATVELLRTRAGPFVSTQFVTVAKRSVSPSVDGELLIEDIPVTSGATRNLYAVVRDGTFSSDPIHVGSTD